MFAMIVSQLRFELAQKAREDKEEQILVKLIDQGIQLEKKIECERVK